MTKIMNMVAFGMAMAFAIVTPGVFAQDDLDDLLKDLEGGSKAKPAAKAEVKSEPKAEVKAEAEMKPEAEVKAEVKPEVKAAVEAKAEVEEKVAEAKPEVKAEPKAEVAEVKAEAEEKVAETKAEVKAEPQAEAEKKVAEAKADEPIPAKKIDEVNSLLKELASETISTSAKPAETPVAAAEQKVVEPVNPDAELISNIAATEKLRRRAMNAQARREVKEADGCMENKDFLEAVRHYSVAIKLLNDSPSSRDFRKECEKGIADGLYYAALQEDDLGRRDKAVQLMEKAVDMRHPKARRVLEKWNSVEEVAVPVDVTDIKHRRNDEEYKLQREQIRKHLRRSRQYLGIRDMEKALEECEVVLVNDPYNQEAIRLRAQIQKKRQIILQQERKASRDGMIADVDETWRPVYAVNAAQLSEAASETVKTQVGDDPERTQEQDIEQRMKAMRLPTISFKPPATIMDAVEFFRQASKDYDRPDIPLEKRGFNFVLKTPQPLKAAAGGAAEAEADDFSANANENKGEAPANGLDPIPTITASDITFYEALKLVCDSVDYKFIVRGPVVMVMHKDMSTAELLSRKYDVLDAFLERMTAASSDVKEMKSSGFGGSNKKDDEGEENQERDWKAFFEQMGVKWPEGSSIMHIKTLGKLYVRNTRENLAEFEKVLQEMGSQTKLIEIETRFVEVSQQDLNSLGFEWILNSDYSLNVGSSLGKALRLNNGTWGTEGGSKYWSSDASKTGTDIANSTIDDGKISSAWESSLTKKSGNSYSRTEASNSNGASWITGDGDTRNIGVNAFGGTDSKYGNGNRYLSTTGNAISGESKSTNDQFMRVNAFLGTADLSMILHMLSQRTDTDLLSAPKVVTKSGENAVIKVVTEYIYPQDYDVQLQSSSSSSSGSSGGGSSSAILAVVEPQNFTMREVGVILDVTPTYSEANGGTIDLELKPSVVEEPTWHNYGMRIPFTGNPSSGGFIDPSTLFSWIPGATEKLGQAVNNLIDAQADTVAAAYLDSAIASMNPSTITYYDAPMEQPFFAVRSIDSKVSITPGATVVMGGLITEQRKAMDDKIPFLGDLPFVGRLFRSHSEQTIKRNLLIFVTGRLITPAGRELRLNEETVDEAEVKAAPEAK